MPKLKSVLTTTYVNSFLISFRLLIESKTLLSQANLSKGFSTLNSFNFSLYRSSQYKRMAEKIVDKYVEN
jgi:hypothetical protein